MFRLQKVSLTCLTFMLWLVSASGADDPLTFHKDIKLDEETQKDLGGKTYPLVDVLFPEDSTIIALAESVGSGKLVRFDLKTEKVQIGSELKLGWSDKPLFQYGENVWLSSTFQGFKHSDLSSPITPKKKKGELVVSPDQAYLTATQKWVFVETLFKENKIHFVFKKRTVVEISKASSIEHKPTTGEIKRRASEHTSMTYLFAEIPAKEIPEEYTHWLVRPDEKEKEKEVIKLKLPAPASRVVSIDTRQYLIGTDSGSIHLLDVTQPDKMTLIDAKFDFTVNDLEITKDKRFAFCSSLDRKKDNLIVLELETKKIIQRHQLKQPSFHRLSLSPNEKSLAINNGTDTISLFEVNLPAKK